MQRYANWSLPSVDVKIFQMLNIKNEEKKHKQ